MKKRRHAAACGGGRWIQRKGDGRAANPAATPFYWCNTAFGDDWSYALCRTKIWKDPSVTDGLGTEAIAPIIELLSRARLPDQKGHIHSTDAGKALSFAARNGDATDRLRTGNRRRNQRKAVSPSDFASRWWGHCTSRLIRLSTGQTVEGTRYSRNGDEKNKDENGEKTAQKRMTVKRDWTIGDSEIQPSMFINIPVFIFIDDTSIELFW